MAPGYKTLNADGTYTYDSTKLESYMYKANGKVDTKTDEMNRVTAYDYDIHGRLLKETCGKLSIERSYDNNGNLLNITNKELGETINTINSITRTYDALNRVTSKNVSGIGSVTYNYDVTTNMDTGCVAETMQYPSGTIVTKVYDRAGRLSKVIAAGQTTQYNYNDNGTVASVVYANGSNETYTYYADNQLSTLVNKKSGGTVIDSYSYTYDEANNMLTKTDSLGTTNYTYDVLNRLLTESIPNLKSTAYTYDAAGNRETEIVSENGISTATTYTYNPQNRLDSTLSTQNGSETQGVSYIYDYNGNNTEERVTLYVNGQPQTEVVKLTNIYDEFNQLIQSVTDAGISVENTYNGEGYRIQKLVSQSGTITSTTRYLYEGNKVVGEYNYNQTTQTLTQKALNIYGLNLLERVETGNTYFYMYNGHADVTALLNASGNTVDATYYYDAFGKVLSKTGTVNNSIRYAGYQYDEETGLYYLNARMYDPDTARFMQEDTYRGDKKDPLSLNLYSYCANNPIKYMDPTGHNRVTKKISSYYNSTVDWCYNESQKFEKGKTEIKNWGKKKVDSVKSGIKQYGLMGYIDRTKTKIYNGAKEGAVEGAKNWYHNTLKKGNELTHFFNSLEPKAVIDKLVDFVNLPTKITPKNIGNYISNKTDGISKGLSNLLSKDIETQTKVITAHATESAIDFGAFIAVTAGLDLAAGLITKVADGIAKRAAGRVLEDAAESEGKAILGDVLEKPDFKKPVTGTVWDDIVPTADDLPGTNIPATFQVKLNNNISYVNPQTETNVLWTNANATEHMGEYISRFGADSESIGIRSQVMLESYTASLNEAMVDLGAKSSGKYFGTYGNWELGINTKTGVVYHARIIM